MERPRRRVRYVPRVVRVEDVDAHNARVAVWRAQRLGNLSTLTRDRRVKSALKLNHRAVRGRLGDKSLQLGGG